LNNATNQARPYLKSAVLFVLLCVSVLHGCAVAVIGLGAGAGAVAYFNGRLTKTYESDFHETVRASKDSLEELKIPLTDVVSDELKTVINARRPDGTPVTIEIVRVDQVYSDVSVRTGSVGVWDRRVSEQIHGFIDKALGGKVVLFEERQQWSAAEETRAVIEPEEIIEQDLAGISASAPQSVSAPTPILAATPAQVNPDSESIIPALEVKRLRAAKMLETSDFFIFFKEDSNELSPESMEKLDRIYSIVAKNVEIRLTLNGYSDIVGAPSYNQMISELRANAIKSYLVGKGVDPSRITTVAHGAQNAIATNKTAEGRRMNRRVEIDITTTSQ
jgi:outer membrane protein OmpA-like peptidoglycan-associated protein